MSAPSKNDQSIPVPPSRIEQERAYDLSSLGTFAAHRQNTTDELVSKMAERFPILPQILSAPTLERQIAIVGQNLGPEALGPLIMMLRMIEYFYHAKDRKPAEALHLALLRYALALQMPEQAPEANDTQLSRTRQIADALESIGSCNADLGLNAKALEYYHQAETLFLQDQQERAKRNLPPMSEFDRLFGGRPALADLYGSMARLSGELGDADQQRLYIGKMHSVQQGNLGPEILFDRAISSGLQGESEGNFDSALEAYVNALDLALGDMRNIMVTTRRPAIACHHLGKAMTHLGLFRKALWYHRQAIEMNRGTGHLGRLANDHVEIGRVYAQRPRYGDARLEFQAALECVSAPSGPGDPFSWASSDGTFRVLDPDFAWQPALELAQQHRAAGEFGEAERFLRLAISLSEAARSSVLTEAHLIGVQGHHAEVYDAMVSLQAALSTPGQAGDTPQHARKALEYAEQARGRAFLDSIGASSMSPPPSIKPELLAREAALLERLRLLRQHKDPSNTSPQAGSALTLVWDKYEQTRRELETVWQTMAAQESAAEYVAIRCGRPIDWESLAELIRSDGVADTRRTVLAAYFDTGDAFLLMVARDGDSQPAILPLRGNRTAMHEAMLAHLRGGAGISGRKIDIPALQAVMQPLLEPLCDYTEKDDRIWFVPHGFLHFLPFHAFEFDGRPLTDRNTVCYSPSASVMKYCRVNRRPEGARSLIVADSRPEMPLLFARQQAAAIGSTLGGGAELLMGPRATKSRLKEILSAASPLDVVHLACHGVFNSEDPLSSGILLAPEGEADPAIVTARDLLEWRIPADLVTLSACQSGLSERLAGDELIGLTRAMLHAGAASVVVSLWSVDEISTSFFMEAFYEEMKASDKAEALRKAAVRLKGMTASEAIRHCEEARAHCETADSLALIEEDIASFEFRARDFEAALARYSQLRSNLPESSSEFGRVNLAMSRCRLALKTALQPDYGVQPFSHPYYWAPFVLIGSWS